MFVFFRKFCPQRHLQRTAFSLGYTAQTHCARYSHAYCQKATNNNALSIGQSVVLKNVFFATDSYELQAQSNTELNRLAQLLTENPTLRIEIGGHTDSTGTAAHNLELSSKRAKAVYDYLTTQKIEPKRLSYKGYGSTRPIADNRSSQGRAANRRTEFTVKP
ncbi:MAG: OmpA family protein [Sphingobacteriales bacterium]|nr:OmpA family protein [Sphingobacteriales bacterium]